MDELQQVIEEAFRECGMGRNYNLAEPIANAVRAYLASDGVVERGHAAIAGGISEDELRVAVSAMIGPTPCAS